MLTFNLKTTFFTVKTSNEVYCCRIHFVNYIQNVHIINRTLHGSLEDMDFMFSWQEQYLTRSLRSLVRYCSCHSNIKSISSRNRVISYIYLPLIYLYLPYNCTVISILYNNADETLKLMAGLFPVVCST